MPHEEVGELDGKVCLITGAAGRIGRALVQVFTSRGARVVASDVDEAGLHTATLGLDPAPSATVADLSDVRNAELLVNETFEREGRLDVLVNNGAVLEGDGTLLDCTEEVFDLMFAVNVKAIFFMSKAAIPRMIEQGGGTIINFSSVLATVGYPKKSAYPSTKGAVLALTRQISVDFAAQGIRCNAICPGTTAPEEQLRDLPDEVRERFNSHATVKRVGRPEEIAEVTAFVASDRASFMHGSAVMVDGGFTAH